MYKLVPSNDEYERDLCFYFRQRKVEERRQNINDFKASIKDSFMEITPLLLELYKNYIEFNVFRVNEKSMKKCSKFYRMDNSLKSKIHRILFRLRDLHGQRSNRQFSDLVNNVLPFSKFRGLPENCQLPEIKISPVCTCQLVNNLFKNYVILD
jgi:hypothetical protein